MIPSRPMHAVIDNFTGHFLALHDTREDAELAKPRVAAHPEGFEVAPVLVTIERLPAVSTSPLQTTLFPERSRT